MKKNMLFAFLLNLAFSVFEFVGGMVTGSIAITSDALHDLGDAVGIGIACTLEGKSHHPADSRYTFGYGRYSLLGSALTTLILILGSAVVMAQAVGRILHPVEIDYHGMILFALVGVAVNLVAAILTHRGESLNQRAINLHMLEDVLGWVIVLIGAVVMRFFRAPLLDPLLSMGVAIYIFIHALKTAGEVLDIFLEKAPRDIPPQALTRALEEIPQVEEVRHLHLWSLDGVNHLVTVHLVTSGDPDTVVYAARQVLGQQGISHATIEVERPGREESHCAIQNHHHHHHHH